MTWRVFLAVGMLLSATLPLAAQPLPELPDAGVVARHFEAVVFRTEAGEGAAGKPLVRWASPVHARVEGAAGPKGLALMDDLFGHLQKLTGLPFRRVEAGEPANMVVRFVPTAEVRRKIGNPNINCAGQLHGKRGTWVIVGAEVYISTDDERRTRHCIVEEITQVLGLTNDSTATADTIFNDTSQRLKLSLIDQILVRTLYDKRLQPGMEAAEAMPIARRVIDDMLGRLRAGIERQRREREEGR